MQMTTRTFAGLSADTRGVDDERAPLVFLHGLTFDRRIWRPALRELAVLDPGRRSVAFDLPGHGRSADLPSYRLPAVVARLHAAIDAMGVRAPILVGHSVSAIVATLYAALRPTRGVVAVGQSLHVTPFASFLKQHATEIEGSGFDEMWQRLWTAMKPHLLPPRVERQLERSSRPRQDVAVGYWRDLLDRPLPDLSVWMSTRLRALRAARIPYHVVVGDQLDSGYHDWLASQLPQMTATVLPRSGHFPHVAYPRRVAELVASFPT
jgi:pimeloyl-ACP methyl ester carboxylesterase